jgi:hypothetical protein
MMLQMEDLRAKHETCTDHSYCEAAPPKPCCTSQNVTSPGTTPVRLQAYAGSWAIGHCHNSPAPNLWLRQHRHRLSSSHRLCMTSQSAHSLVTDQALSITNSIFSPEHLLSFPFGWCPALAFRRSLKIMWGKTRSHETRNNHQGPSEDSHNRAEDEQTRHDWRQSSNACRG